MGFLYSRVDSGITGKSLRGSFVFKVAETEHGEWLSPLAPHETVSADLKPRQACSLERKLALPSGISGFSKELCRGRSSFLDFKPKKTFKVSCPKRLPGQFLAPAFCQKQGSTD